MRLKNRKKRSDQRHVTAMFKAKLVGAQGSPRRFAREDYEAKPAEWKMCFRAGKEATEAARAFAREWIKSLE